MSKHLCANCRRPLTATTVLLYGKLCAKCDWAAGADAFRDDSPTRPKETIRGERVRIVG